MNWSKFFKAGNSAPVARERLQILLAHERSALGRSNLIALLKEEILAAISRHIAIDSEKIQIKMDRGAKVSTLEFQVEIPNTVGLK